MTHWREHSPFAGQCVPGSMLAVDAICGLSLLLVSASLLSRISLGASRFSSLQKIPTLPNFYSTLEG